MELKIDNFFERISFIYNALDRVIMNGTSYDPNYTVKHSNTRSRTDVKFSRIGSTLFSNAETNSTTTTYTTKGAFFLSTGAMIVAVIQRILSAIITFAFAYLYFGFLGYHLQNWLLLHSSYFIYILIGIYYFFSLK